MEHNLLEMTIVGTIIEHPFLLKESGINKSQFESKTNVNIITVVEQLMNEGKAVEFVTILMHQTPEFVGGASYLTTCIDNSNIDKFNGRVADFLDKWKQRETRRIQNISLQEGWNAQEIIQKLSDLDTTRIDDRKSIKNELVKYFEMPFSQSQKVDTGIESGITELDKLIEGFRPKEFTIISARPSVGKTDVILTIGKNAGLRHIINKSKKRVIPVVFSLEMETELLVLKRLIPSTVGFNRGKTKDLFNLLTAEQKEKWSANLGMLSESGFEFFDKPGQKVSEMRSKVRLLQNEYPDCDFLVMIDYLSIIKPEQTGQNRNIEIGQIANDLKTMAKELSVHVIALSQLSRSIESRPNKRPMNSDLRESGEVEQIADMIIGLYREGYYNEELNKGTWQPFEFCVTKNRNGGVGTVTAAYNRFLGVIK
ncbi:MAG: DnaB-like helicase C-terminal domain-containing protein [Solibacillus isronensis]